MTYLMNQISQLIQISRKSAETEPYYEVLEKITLSGVEYFDLGYKVSDFAIGDTIRFEGIVKGTDASTITSSGSQLMYSIGNDGGQWLGKAQNGTKYAFGSLNQSTISFNEEVLADVTIALSGNANKPTFTITGSVTSDTATSTITQRSATPTYYDFPLLFGAGTKSTGEKAYGGDYTIKCGKIYINGIITKDFIPVLDSQMRPCLYDRIGKTFTYAKKIADGTDSTDTLAFKRWNKYDVDYIKNDTNSYIKTGVIDENGSLSFEADFTYFSGSGYQYVLGAYGGDSYKNTVLYINSTNSIGAWVNKGYSQSAMLSNIIEANARIKCYADTTKSTINEYTTTTFVEGTERAGAELYVFRRNGDGGSTQPQSTSNAIIGLHSLKISIGDAIVRDFKPSVRTYNDGSGVVTKAFLYDEVYNKAYDNAGTGSFKAYIVGADDTVYEVGAYVSGTPSSVSGTSNCFDTGIYGTQDTQVNLVSMALDTTTSSGQLFGSYDGTTSTSQNLTINSTGTGNTAPIRFDGQAITTPIKVANTMASIVENKYGLWVNNALHGTWGSVSDFTTTTSLLVLKCNNSQNVRSNGCFYLAIYENGQLVAEYIPVKNASDATKFGLYDTVSKTLNTGVGTLTFVAIS